MTQKIPCYFVYSFLVLLVHLANILLKYLFVSLVLHLFCHFIFVYLTPVMVSHRIHYYVAFCTVKGGSYFSCFFPGPGNKKALDQLPCSSSYCFFIDGDNQKEPITDKLCHAVFMICYMYITCQKVRHIITVSASGKSFSWI